jgi:hypothetical protein
MRPNLHQLRKVTFLFSNLNSYAMCWKQWHLLYSGRLFNYDYFMFESSHLLELCLTYHPLSPLMQKSATPVMSSGLYHDFEKNSSDYDATLDH